MTEQYQLQLKAAREHPLNKEASQLLSLAGEQELAETMPILQLAKMVAWEQPGEEMSDQALYLANLEAQRTPQQILKYLETQLTDQLLPDQTPTLGDDPQEAGTRIADLLGA
jgi:hypothetical protein